MLKLLNSLINFLYKSYLFGLILEEKIIKKFKILYAEVAELADAPDSGSGGGNAVRVQIPPSALYKLLMLKAFKFKKLILTVISMVSMLLNN